MASFASSATMGGARKHAWTNNYMVLFLVFSPFTEAFMLVQYNVKDRAAITVKLFYTI